MFLPSIHNAVVPEAEGGYPGPIFTIRVGAWVPALPRLKAGVGRDDGR
jgi:hypothetical protein